MIKPFPCRMLMVFPAFVLAGTAVSYAVCTSAPTTWGATSPWNQPIGNAPVLSASSAVISAFVSSGQGINYNWDAYTPPIIQANSATDPLQSPTFFDSGRSWTMVNLPVNANLLAYANYRNSIGDTDGMTCIFDSARNGYFSMWQAVNNGGRFSFTTGGFSPNTGPGWSAVTKNNNNPAVTTPELGRSVGATYCGGLILPSEITAGNIPHALAIIMPNNLTLRVDFGVQFPATYSDGQCTNRATCVPMGSRMQLDPTLTDAKMMAMGVTNKTDLIVAHALQVYGGYIVDSAAPTTSGGVGAISFQNMEGNGQATYGTRSPFPHVLYGSLRIVGPPPMVPLDTAAAVGNPVP